MDSNFPTGEFLKLLAVSIGRGIDKHVAESLRGIGIRGETEDNLLLALHWCWEHTTAHSVPLKLRTPLAFVPLAHAISQSDVLRHLADEPLPGSLREFMTKGGQSPLKKDEDFDGTMQFIRANLKIFAEKAREADFSNAEHPIRISTSDPNGMEPVRGKAEVLSPSSSQTPHKSRSAWTGNKAQAMDVSQSCAIEHKAYRKGWILGIAEGDREYYILDTTKRATRGTSNSLWTGLSKARRKHSVRLEASMMRIDAVATAWTNWPDKGPKPKLTAPLYIRVQFEGSYQREIESLVKENGRKGPNTELERWGAESCFRSLCLSPTDREIWTYMVAGAKVMLGETEAMLQRMQQTCPTDYARYVEPLSV